ncbi:MAG: hypothetical protein H0T92_12900 [Pyrinomonadaceae bacterium]|nr:hypothetical protein [Pyrinomonadaceae bacterium]
MIDKGLVKFSLTAFVTLLVVVDPPGMVPIVVSLTEGADAASWRAIMNWAVTCTTTPSSTATV